MSDRAGAAAIPPSGARRCRLPDRGESRRRCAPSGLDRLAHSLYARRPAARQHQLPDVEIGDVGASCTPAVYSSAISTAKASSLTAAQGTSVILVLNQYK